MGEHKGGEKMANYTSKSYTFAGTAGTGETIVLSVNSAEPFNETVPSWATTATIKLTVVFG